MTQGEFSGASRDYDRIEKAIRFIETRFEERPGLQEIAGHVGMSEFHFQRLFSRWVGISPKRFLQFLTKEHVKALLAQRPVLEAALAAGLSGPGRLHDLFVTCEAVTPGEFKAQGRGLVIRHGIHASPFGECLVGLTERGVCWLSFVPDGSPDDRVDEMRSAWANARFVEDRAATRAVVARIYDPAQWRPDRPAAGPGQGHQLPDQGLGGAPAHPARHGGRLRGRRAADRPPPGRARRGQRGRQEPGQLRDPLPPGGAQDGRLRQLRRRTGAQEGHVGVGVGPGGIARIEEET